MRNLKFTKEEILNLINNHATAEKIVKFLENSVCARTIINYMKIYGIQIPSGFHKKEFKKPRKPMSEERKKQFSEKFKGENNPFYGKKHTEATKKKMKENHADFSGENNPFKKACDKNPNLIEECSKIRIKYWSKLTKDQKYNRNKQTIYKDIPKNFWTRTISNAKSRNFEFSITPEFAWGLLEKQNFRCNLSGVEINIKSIDEITASIDRIDSSKGYTESNIQWVHKDINYMKQNFEEKKFINYCRLVWENKSDIK